MPEARPTLALIHTVHQVIPAFEEICARRLPGVKTNHILDESMLRDVIDRGELDADVIARVAELVVRAERSGAAAVLITCSSIGACADRAQPLVSIPVRRVDAPMATAAVRRGGMVGVAATLSTTLDPTTALVRSTAKRFGKRVRVTTALFAEAFRARMAGKPEVHDRILGEGLAALMRTCRAVVLAQASMARVADTLTIPEGVKVLTSPESGVAQMRRLLERKV